MIRTIVLLVVSLVFSANVSAQERAPETYEILSHDGVPFRATSSAIRDAYSRLQISEDVSKVAYITVWGEFLYYKIVSDDAVFSEKFYRPLGETFLQSRFGGRLEQFALALDGGLFFRLAKGEAGYESKKDRIRAIMSFLQTALSHGYSVKWFADSLDGVYAYFREAEPVR